MPLVLSQVHFPVSLRNTKKSGPLGGGTYLMAVHQGHRQRPTHLETTEPTMCGQRSEGNGWLQIGPCVVTPTARYPLQWLLRQDILREAYHEGIIPHGPMIGKDPS